MMEASLEGLRVATVITGLEPTAITANSQVPGFSPSINLRSLGDLIQGSEEIQL